MIKIMYGLIAIALIAGVASAFFVNWAIAPEVGYEPGDNQVMCTMDAIQCPDGSYVGRTGPNCQFVCPDLPEVPADVQTLIDAKADKIVLTIPAGNSVVATPLELSGEAWGPWYFEATFPIVLTNWDGLIIGEGYAQAQSDWMTTDFVPFVSVIEFTNPYHVGDPDFMKNGTLILQKSNASGLPEHDDALEIPVRFAL